LARGSTRAAKEYRGCNRAQSYLCHRECRPGHEHPASRCHHQLDRGAEEEM